MVCQTGFNSLHQRNAFQAGVRRQPITFVLSVLNPGAELGLIRTEGAPDLVLFARNLGYKLGPEAVMKEIGRRAERNSCATGDKTANKKRVLWGACETKAEMV